MAKRLRLSLAALLAASLLIAPAFTASASAHEVTRVDTRPRYVCEYVYVPDFLSYEARCEWRSENRTVKRWHIHTTKRVCTWVTVGSSVAGGVIGLPGAGTAIAGGGIGALVGYEVCRSLPRIIWLS